MPERTFSSPEYRYGFNGKEKDEDEEWGDLTHYDYGFRIYNPGVGRFLSVDPLTGEYPFFTPFQYASNSPIWMMDVDGMEGNPSTNKSIRNNAGVHTRAFHVARETIKKFGNNIEVESFGSRVFQETLGIDTEPKSIRTNGAIDFVHGHASGSYQEGTVEYASYYNLIGEYINITSYLSSVNPDLYLNYNGLVDEAETIGGKLAVIALMTTEVKDRNMKFDLMGLILSAYGAASGALSPPSIVSIKNFTYYTTTKEATVTLYRSISAAEAKSVSSGYMSFADDGMQVKQFWSTKEGLKKWSQTDLGDQFVLEIQVPKSTVGKGKIFDTSVQVDEFIGPNATIMNRKGLEAANNAVIKLEVKPNIHYIKKVTGNK